MTQGFRIALAVAGDLGKPVIPVRFGNPRAARAVMPVPEAAMDEDRLLAAEIGDVRIAGNVPAVQAVADN